jgi:glycosyltransferase involved in cell wall biosynthesis
MSRLTLGVVVPLHNGVDTVLDALASLQAQHDPVDRVVVVDDGSTDAGWSAVIAAHPDVEVVVLDRNHEVGFARNSGIAVLDTDLVSFLDQHDIWLANRSSRLRALMTNNAAWDAVVTGVQVFATTSQETLLGGHPFKGWVEHWVNEGGEVANLSSSVNAGPIDKTGEEISLAHPLNRTVAVTTAYAFRRALFLAVGGCATWLRSAGDCIMLQNMARHGTVVRVDEKSLLYRVHSSNTSLDTEWGIPLLVASAAIRHGQAVVPRDCSQDHVTLGRLVGSDSVTDLIAAATRTSSFREQCNLVAVATLLATDTADRKTGSQNPGPRPSQGTGASRV